MNQIFSLEKLLYTLFGLYIIVIPCNEFLDLPYIADKIQLPEILFLVISFVFLRYFGSQKIITALQKWQFSRIDKGILAFFSALCLATAIHPTTSSIIEIIGYTYLMTYYVLLNLFFKNKSFQVIPFVTYFFTLSGMIAALLGLLGWIIVMSTNIENRLVMLFENYPYFGDVHRIRALTSEPTMLASILGICILILAVKSQCNLKNLSTWERIALLLMFTVEILTFTKSIVALGACILILGRTIFFKNNPFFAISCNLVAGISLLVFVFFTHFVVIKIPKYELIPIEKRDFHKRTENIPFAKIGSFFLIRTTYGVLKSTAYQAFKKNPLTGIGGGNFASFCDKQKINNQYPLYLGSFDPVSTYSGVLSELGIIGFIALLYLMYSIFITLNLLSNINDLLLSDKLFVLGLGSILLFMASEAVVTDITNFRHYWSILAVLAIIDRNNLKN